MDMVSPYPKVEVKGVKQLFIFRFPKFNTEAFYDPTMELSPKLIPTPTELSSTSKPLVFDPTIELSSTPAESRQTSKPLVSDTAIEFSTTSKPSAWADPAQELTVASTSAKREEFGGPGAEPPERFLGATPLGLPENALSIKESGLSVHLLE